MGQGLGYSYLKIVVLIITLVNPYLNVKMVFKDLVFKSLKPENLPMLRFREHFWATKEKSGRFVRAICRLFVVVEEEEKRGGGMSSGEIDRKDRCSLALFFLAT